MAVLIRHLGIQPYQVTWQAMQDWITNVSAEASDEVWLLEHLPVFTLGQASDKTHLLNTQDIPVVQSDRGGQVTYHAPGQLVVYFLLNLKRYHLGAKALVNRVERILIKVLAENGIEGQADPKRPGIYVSGAKVASLGFRIRRGYSYHGVALNVDMDLAPFGCINPCGYTDLMMTDMQSCLGKPVQLAQVEQQIVANIKQSFKTQIVAVDE